MHPVSPPEKTRDLGSPLPSLLDQHLVHELPQLEMSAVIAVKIRPSQRAREKTQLHWLSKTTTCRNPSIRRRWSSSLKNSIESRSSIARGRRALTIRTRRGLEAVVNSSEYILLQKAPATTKTSTWHHSVKRATKRLDWTRSESKPLPAKLL